MFSKNVYSTVVSVASNNVGVGKIALYWTIYHVFICFHFVFSIFTDFFFSKLSYFTFIRRACVFLLLAFPSFQPALQHYSGASPDGEPQGSPMSLAARDPHSLQLLLLPPLASAGNCNFNS